MTCTIPTPCFAILSTRVSSPWDLSLLHACFVRPSPRPLFPQLCCPFHSLCESHFVFILDNRHVLRVIKDGVESEERLEFVFVFLCSVRSVDSFSLRLFPRSSVTLAVSSAHLSALRRSFSRLSPFLLGTRVHSRPFPRLDTDPRSHLVALLDSHRSVHGHSLDLPLE